MAYNADNTKNKGGHITKSIDLFITQGNLKKKMTFLVSNLGSNCLILGYPWLQEFNPNMDWKEAKIIGSKIRIYTTNLETNEERYIRLFRIHLPEWLKEKVRARYQEKLRKLCIGPEQPVLSDGTEAGMHINKITTATEMAQRTHNLSKVNTKETIPPHYRHFRKVFSDEEA